MVEKLSRLGDCRNNNGMKLVVADKHQCYIFIIII